MTALRAISVREYNGSCIELMALPYLTYPSKASFVYVLMSLPISQLLGNSIHLVLHFLAVSLLQSANDHMKGLWFAVLNISFS